MEGSGQQHASDTIPHQDQTEDVIRATAAEVLADASEQVAIANAVVAAGANPTKAEYDVLVGKFNAVLGVLRDSDLIPAA